MKANFGYVFAIAVFQRSSKVSSRKIKRVDGSIPEIANQDIVAERAEAGAGLSDSPRRVQSSASREAPLEIAVHIENIDNAVSGAEDGVVLRGVLQRIGHENLSSNYLNSERRKVQRQIWIHKRTRKRHGIESGKKSFDESAMEIRDR